MPCCESQGKSLRTEFSVDLPGTMWGFNLIYPWDCKKIALLVINVPESWGRNLPHPNSETAEENARSRAKHPMLWKLGQLSQVYQAVSVMELVFGDFSILAQEEATLFMKEGKQKTTGWDQKGTKQKPSPHSLHVMALSEAPPVSSLTLGIWTMSWVTAEGA